MKHIPTRDSWGRLTAREGWTDMRSGSFMGDGGGGCIGDGGSGF